MKKLLYFLTLLLGIFLTAGMILIRVFHALNMDLALGITYTIYYNIIPYNINTSILLLVPFMIGWFIRKIMTNRKNWIYWTILITVYLLYFIISILSLRA